MKGIYESIFMSALRAFFVATFSILGIALACLIVGLAYFGLHTLVEEESFSSKIKILADASGHRTKLGSKTPLILQITLDGEIGKDKLTGKTLENNLLDIQDEDFTKDRLKGILLVINSPGGGVNDSDIIYRHISHYKKQFNVPVFAYIDGLCASGGYYIACAADQIYASDVSLIGSIGVLAWPPFVNLVDGLEKLGISALTLSAGEGKDLMNPFRTWKPDEQQQYQKLINFYYNSFIDIVAANRPIDREQLVEKLGAKVYPAVEAEHLKLIDKSGMNRNQTLSALIEAAHIKDKYQVIGFESKSWWRKVFKEESTSPLLTGTVKHELALPTFQGNPFSYK